MQISNENGRPWEGCHEKSDPLQRGDLFWYALPPGMGGKTGRFRYPPPRTVLDVKPDGEYIPILDDIVFPLKPEQTFFPDPLLGTIGH